MTALSAKKPEHLKNLQQAWAKGTASGLSRDLDFSRIKRKARHRLKCNHPKVPSDGPRP